MSLLMVAMVLVTLPGVGFAPAVYPDPEEPTKPNQPEAKVESVPIATPAPMVAQSVPLGRNPHGLTEGRASWYDYVPGGAAAGPRLRSVLGDDWRGQRVFACLGDNCVSVVLSDWCQCYKGEANERVIDLDDGSFKQLAPLSTGVIKGVTIWTSDPRAEGSGSGPWSSSSRVGSSSSASWYG